VIDDDPISVALEDPLRYCIVRRYCVKTRAFSSEDWRKPTR